MKELLGEDLQRTTPLFRTFAKRIYCAMRVANPIYDVVFKYLLDDEKVAIILLSNVLGKKIDRLELASRELPLELAPKNITVFRIDFKATVTLENGEKKLILIEIQKAKFASDILRFRRYLGMQYADQKNFVETKKGKKALPIHTIYFLGYPLPEFPECPIINVGSTYTDNYSKQTYHQRSEFIESLTHDSIIIQIPLFKQFRRSKLEKLLAIFEASTNHEVEVEEDNDREYDAITRRLLRANSDEQIRQLMDVEDELLEELGNLERKAEEATKEKEEAIKREKAERKQKEEAQKREKEAQTALKRMVKKMHTRGFSLAEIAEDVGKTEAEILKMLEE